MEGQKLIWVDKSNTASQWLWEMTLICGKINDLLTKKLFKTGVIRLIKISHADPSYHEKYRHPHAATTETKSCKTRNIASFFTTCKLYQTSEGGMLILRFYHTLATCCKHPEKKIPVLHLRYITKVGICQQPKI